MERTVICPVGLSLNRSINNYCKSKGKDSENVYRNCLDSFNKENCQYKNTISSFAGHLKNLQREEFKAQASAELSAIYSYFWFNPDDKLTDKDKIILIPSHTADGVKCANTIKDIIKNNCFPDKSEPPKVEIKPEEGVQDLDTTFPDKLEKKGLPCFTRLLTQYILEELEENRDVFVNITGGYKITLVYASMVAMCINKPDREVKIIFKHETFQDRSDTSSGAITVHHLPVDFDLLSWNDNRGLLELLINEETARNNKALIEAIPKPLRFIFDTENIELLKVFDERLKAENRLSYYGSGLIYPHSLLKNDDRLRTTLENWLTNSQYIWYGDIIKETVDHSRGHAQRLHQMAVQILLPILELDNDYLTSYEIFVLGITLWLHDIGHCEGEIMGYNISEFPSLIRDLHHATAWDLIRQEITSNNNNNRLFKFNEELKKEDVLLSGIAYYYHRGKMPLENVNTTSEMKPYPIVEEETKSPIHKVKEVINEIGDGIENPFESSGKISEKNFQFIIALQRIIDACDVHYERNVNNEFLQRKRNNIKQQRNNNIEMINELLDALLNIIEIREDNHSDKDLLNDILLILQQKINLENNQKIEEMSKKIIEKLNNQTNTENKSPKRIYRKLLENVFTQNKINPSIKRFLVKQLMSSIDKLIFREEQTKHYDKHQIIQSVIFVKDSEKEYQKNEYNYKLIMLQTDEKLKSKYDEKKYQNSIINEIKEEYNKVKHILSKKGIILTKIELRKKGTDNPIEEQKFDN